MGFSKGEAKEDLQPLGEFGGRLFFRFNNVIYALPRPAQKQCVGAHLMGRVSVLEAEICRGG